MELWLIYLLLAVVLVIFALALVPVGKHAWNAYRARRAGPAPEQQDPHIIDMVSHSADGATVAEAPAPSPRRARFAFFDRLPRPEMPQLQAPTPPPFLSQHPLLAAGMVLLLVGLVAAAVWMGPDIRERMRDDQFVVLVASFADGSDGLTGAAVADELAGVLRNDGGATLVVERVALAPTNGDVALSLAAEHQADLVIWGQVQAGSMLDSASLEPHLTYQPTGAHAPHAWGGYMGRFALPHSHALATEPVNGQVVLPPLVLAVADYSTGQADRAHTTLGNLLDTYPLHTAFPRMLRGNILWARANYSAAAGEYRRALAQANPAAQAALSNNLAVILSDAGDPAAPDAFAAAVVALEGADLAELRYNLGVQALDNNALADALLNLEQARALVGADAPTTPLLLTLAAAYREDGQLAQAETTLDAADDQLWDDLDSVPAHLQPLLELQLQGALKEQQGLLAMAQLVEARGPLAWELEVPHALEPQELEVPTSLLQAAVNDGTELVAEWRRLAAAYAAEQTLDDLPDDEPVASVPMGQVEYNERTLEHQQYHLALLLTEESRLRRLTDQSMLATLWQNLIGTGDPLAQARRLFDDLIVATPQDVPFLLGYARTLRLPPADTALLDEADQQYDAIIALAPDNPAAYYGKGQVALLRGDEAATRTWMDEALNRNAAYYPARVQLISFAEQQQDWATAQTHLRILYEQYPSEETALHLASILRRSGDAGFAEARQVLQPLADTGSTAALVELGRIERDAGEMDTSVATLERALASENDPVAAFELGLVQAEQGDYDAATSQLQVAVARGDEDVQMLAHMHLGRIYGGPLSQAERANYHYEQLLEANVQDPVLLLTIGDSLLKHDRPRPALVAYGRAAEQRPNDPAIAHRRAQAYLELGSLGAARTQEERVLELAVAPDQQDLRAAALVGLGDVERLQGNLDSAINLYNQALSINPIQIDAAIGLGLVGVAQDNWGLALNQFERSLNFPGGQQDALAQFWYAEALLRQGDPQRAIDHYTLALDLQPAFPEAQLGIAQAEQRLGNHTAAHAAVERALAQRPEYGEALLFQGKLLQEQGDVEGAAMAYSAAIEADNRLSEAYYRRGVILLNELNNDGALDDLQRAASLQPDNAEYHFWLGQANFALDRMTSARTAFARAVELRNGNYAAARLYQGLSEEALGQLEDAAASFQEVIQQASDSEWVGRAQTELDRMGIQ